MKLRPLGKNVLIRPTEAKRESPGGIVLVSEDKRGPRFGTVIAVAAGIPLEEGMNVLYDRHAATVDAGTGHVLVPFEHVLGVLS